MSDDHTNEPRTDHGRTDPDAERPFLIYHSGARDCGSYRAGHDPHWIQALTVAPRCSALAVHDVRLLDATTIELEVATDDGTGRERVVRRNHDVERIVATWESAREGELVSGASLLRIGAREERAAFSVTSNELGPCRGRGGDGGDGGAR